MVELAQELERQAGSKKDYRTPTGLLEIQPNEGDLRLRVGGQGTFGITDRAHNQLGWHTGIPAKYYDRMKVEAPDLLAVNLNRWLHQADGEGKTPTHLVRTLDGKARAFLSSRYRTIDNADIAEAVLPILARQRVEVISAEVTEDRLYLKAVDQRITFEVKKGDVVQAGIVISNSEVGLGAVRVEPLLYRLICLNGAIIEDAKVRKFHLGRATDEAEAAYEVFRDETREQDDRTFMMKLGDVVRGAFDEVRFQRIAAAAKEADGRLIPRNVPAHEVVEVLVERFHLGEAAGGSILNNLIAGGSLSQWALANAVTATANDEPSYDRATLLERVGGNIITMPKPEWRKLVELNEEAA